MLKLNRNHAGVGPRLAPPPAELFRLRHRRGPNPATIFRPRPRLNFGALNPAGRPGPRKTLEYTLQLSVVLRSKVISTRRFKVTQLRYKISSQKVFSVHKCHPCLYELFIRSLRAIHLFRNISKSKVLYPHVKRLENVS